MKWPKEYINQIICGDCLGVMKRMPSNCVDTIITDPPYNLTSTTRPRPDQSENGSYGRQVPFSRQQSRTGFMGKNWDGTGISFDIKLWEEALRIAKPGSTLLCFGGTRTYHRLACAIEDAGWILKDCIMWLYGSGFPKATDISKQLDKIAGKERKIIGKIPRHYIDGQHWGKPTSRDIVKPFTPGGEYRGKLNIATRTITAPATPEATLWNGWKSHGLKPAYEPIIVAMKPNEGSYANNALNWGVAGLNIKGSRIPLSDNDGKNARLNSNKHHLISIGTGATKFFKKPPGKNNEFISKGRYPANVILDVQSAGLLDEQSGELRPPWGKESESQKDTSWFSGKTDSYGKLYRDTGGASRFFYCAKASKAERNRGCEELPNKLITTHKGKYRKCKKCGKRAMSGTKEQIQYRCQCENPDWEIVETDSKIYITKNNHPTVKPLALMKYLCTLTNTPTGGVVLDPFCGSGTTLMACKELKRDYIGIDNQPEYCEIARKRVNSIPESLF